MESYLEREVGRRRQWGELRARVEAAGLPPDRILGHLRAHPYPAVPFANADRAAFSSVDLPNGFDDPSAYRALQAFASVIGETRFVRISDPVFSEEDGAVIHLSPFAADSLWTEAEPQWREVAGKGRVWCQALSRYDESLWSHYLVGDDPRWAAYASSDDEVVVFATYDSVVTAALRTAFAEYPAGFLPDSFGPSAHRAV